LLAAAVAVGLALAACSGPAPVEFGKEDLATIQKMIGDFVAAYNAKDSTKIAGLFTGSGSVMVPNSAVVHGFESIKGFYDIRLGVQGARDLELNATPTGQGKFAYAVGTYNVRLAPEGVPESRDRGKVLFLFQKMPGNAWRIEILMYSSDLPPVPPPAPVEEKK
jgi:ketosteroid isomerase-like protein